MTVLLQFFGCLSLLVMIHEFGHFITAKMFGVRVEKFYIFFNPGFSLFSFKPKNSETTYGIGWLPLGGYVKLAGMVDESMDTEFAGKEPQSWEFRSKPAWQRLIIMVAGVFMNFILAIGIYIGMLYHWGDDYVAMKDVTYGFEFSWTGLEAGFKDGDVLVAADGEKIEKFDQESAHRMFEAKTVTVNRNGEEVIVNLPSDFVKKMMTEGRGFASYRLPFIVQEVMPNMPACNARILNEPAGQEGLRVGDRILTANGEEAFFSVACKVFKANPNKQVNLSVLRGSDTLQMCVVPDKNGKIGAAINTKLSDIYNVTHTDYSFLEAVPMGISRGFSKLTGYASDMKYVFTPEGAQSMGGFGTLASLFSSTFDLRYFLSITAFLSVILAFMNVLPIPALDGGHAMFVLYEIITRKKPSHEFLVKAQMIGIALLFALMLFANGLDLFRFFK